MRIGPKLLGSFLVMLAFAGVIGIVAVVQLSTVARNADFIATESMDSVYRVAGIRFNSALSRAAALEVLTQLQLNCSSTTLRAPTPLPRL